MASNALRAAQDSLAVQTVQLSGSFSHVRDDFDPSRYGEEASLSQAFHALKAVEELQFDEENAEGYRFIYTLGFRLIGKGENIAASDYVPQLEVIAHFSAKYKCRRKLSEEEVKAFSENNVAYHVWPYWREFLQSTAARMGLRTVIEVPMYRVS